MKTRILTGREVRSLVDLDEVVAAVEAAFAAHGRQECVMPPKVYLSLPDDDGDFRAMPAYLAGAAGVKWVNSHPHNPARNGLPAVMGLYLLSDPQTALPLAVMDATELTALRTGAAAAVASKHLGRPRPRSLGLVGCGAQARALLAAHRAVFGFSLEVLVADLSQEAAEALSSAVGARVASVEEAAGCDLVCTSTPARQPVVRRGWVRPGAHLNAMGADGPGKQELDPALLREGKVVVDDLVQATHSGEINVSWSRGELSEEDLHATLGAIVAGRAPGRSSPDEITIFDSTGLAIQDLAVARVIFDRAHQRGVGAEVDFLCTSERS